MMVDGAETARILRSRREGRDQDVVWSEVAVIERCTFAPGGSFENTDDRNQVVRRASLFAATDQPLPRPGDHVKVRDSVWQCDGSPDVWFDLESRPQGYEQRLKRVTG